jgi:hypothetical protein
MSSFLIIPPSPPQELICFSFFSPLEDYYFIWHDSLSYKADSNYSITCPIIKEKFGKNRENLCQLYEFGGIKQYIPEFFTPKSWGEEDTQGRPGC